MNFQINDIKFNSKNIILANSNSSNPSHTFTIITGKNAAGKSRLLTTIIRNFFSQKEISNKTPNKIIAISNIYSDRFPLKKPINSTSKYEYFGYKSKNKNNDYDSFFYFKNLITKNEINLKSIQTTFKYLGFEPRILVSFSINYSKRNQYNADLRTLIINSYNRNINNFKCISFDTRNITNLYNDINILQKQPPFYSILKFTRSPQNLINDPKEALREEQLNIRYKFLSLDKDEQDFVLILIDIFKKDLLLNVEEFILIFNLIKQKNKENKKSIPIEYIFLENIYSHKKTISSLINKGLISISNISFFKEKNLKEIKFDNLSSGQKSIFNIFFSISSAIEDNSLICIDEPEISLHPEWQSEFIIKLQEVFHTSYGCHFLIATHSPQIVSGLNSENGFVVDLEKNITYSSEEYSKKSADYQLAKIFNAPGHNNEYLIRIGLSLLTKLTQNITFTDEDYNNLKLLNVAKQDLPDNDVVYHLINQINALV